MTVDSRRYEQSSLLDERARQIIPGGHHLSGRALLETEPSPLYFARAQGCRIWDVDGHEYIDYLMAYGAFAVGYANESIDRAASEQLRNGGLVSLNHPLHIEFMESLLNRFPFADMGAFFKTGSDATTAALRIARRATRRRKVVRAGYHGWHDWCLPAETFVPEGLDQQILEFYPNEPGDLERVLESHRGEIAAVILAPEMVHQLDRQRLMSITSSTRAHGSIFILDEIKTAFRTSPGSIYQRFEVPPDILTISKALGNGWPIAAAIGTRAVMQHAAGMHYSGTYHGETAAMAAALMTLKVIDRDAVADHIWKMGERLISGLNERIQQHRIAAVAYGEPLPPMPFMRFTYADAKLNERARNVFFAEVLSRGSFLHPRHLWFVSGAHREDDIDRTLDACDAAFRAVERHVQS